ncbi:Bug family tripartite tricarboxylate transporter substrate binding protein [Ramlibacter sp.]|uniref:Bug family tripartite tricarboxylate transporter substrate binding protein n=1 Tax=Ramlibacter sp. TaxID=1917967 RepID=UPI003D0FB180
MPYRSNRRAFAGALAVVSTLLFAAPLHAQDNFPSRSLKIVVPATAGGTTDVVARTLAEKMSASMGQSVVIDNRLGANGIVAVKAVAGSPPDGYTMLLIHTAYTQNLALRSDQPYSLSEMIPLVLLGRSGTVLAVPSSLGVSTLKDFVEYVRARPGKLSYGSFGVASTAHIYGEMLSNVAKLQVTHVPYKGETAALNDVLSGQLAATWGSAGTFEPHVKAGKLKILAMTGPERMPQYADIPTFVEQGYPMFDLAGWNGVFVPRGTPPAVVDRLTAEVRKGLQSPEVTAKLVGFGFVPVGTQGRAFSQFLDADVAKWTAAAKANNIKAD